MRKISAQIFFLVIVTAVAVFGGPWAVRPFLSPPQGLHPSGWSYTQLIRDRYPSHLIEPEWLENDLTWNLAETAARLELLIVVVLIMFTLAKFVCSRMGSNRGHSPSNSL